MVRLEGGETFWISDRERTVVDAFRLRHLIGDDHAHGALRRYLSERPRLVRLAELAQTLRVWNSPVQRAGCAAGMTQPSLDTTDGRAYLDLRALARRDGRATDELLTLYVLEPFLYRLSRSLHRNRLVLKGGKVDRVSPGAYSVPRMNSMFETWPASWPRMLPCGSGRQTPDLCSIT